MSRIVLLFHSVIIHPIAGILWFVGLERAGDAVHSIGAPKAAA